MTWNKIQLTNEHQPSHIVTRLLHILILQFFLVKFYFRAHSFLAGYLNLILLCVKQHSNKRLLCLCKCVYLCVYMRWWWFMFGQSYSTHLTFVMYSVSCFYPVWRYMNNRLLCIFPFSVYPFLSITVIRYFWHSRTHIYAYTMNIY